MEWKWLDVFCRERYFLSSAHCWITDLWEEKWRFSSLHGLSKVTNVGRALRYSSFWGRFCCGRGEWCAHCNSVSNSCKIKNTCIQQLPGTWDLGFNWAKQQEQINNWPIRQFLSLWRCHWCARYEEWWRSFVLAIWIFGFLCRKNLNPKWYFTIWVWMRKETLILVVMIFGFLLCNFCCLINEGECGGSD